MEALEYSMRKWNQILNTEFMQAKRQRSRYCLWTQKRVDWQGRRLWDLIGKLLLFACSEWTFLEKYRIELCDGSLHFLCFCGWLSCVQCSLNIKFLWICYIVLSFQAHLGGVGGGWEKCAKPLYMNYWWKRSERCAIYSPRKNHPFLLRFISCGFLEG